MTIQASDVVASVERLFWSHGLPPRREYVYQTGVASMSLPSARTATSPVSK